MFRPRSPAVSAPSVSTSSAENQPSSMAPTSYPAASLRRDPTALAPFDNAPDSALENAEQIARRNTLAFINGLRTVAPAIRRALMASDEMRQVAIFQSSMESANRWALSTAKSLGWGDSTVPPWLINGLEKAFLQQTWDNHTWQEIPENPHLITAVQQLLNARDTDDKNWVNRPEEWTVKLALIQTLSALIQVQQTSPLYRSNPDQDLADLAAWLLDRVDRAAQYLVDPVTRPEERHTLWTVLMQESTEIVVTVWREYHNKGQLLIQKSGQKLEAWQAQNPTGWPMNPILEGATLGLNRLVNLVKKIRSGK